MSEVLLLCTLGTIKMSHSFQKCQCIKDHNLYGFHMQKATVEEQFIRQSPSLIEYSGRDIEIQEDIERPFVLSRSFLPDPNLSVPLRVSHLSVLIFLGFFEDIDT